MIGNQNPFPLHVQLHQFSDNRQASGMRYRIIKLYQKCRHSTRTTKRKLTSLSAKGDATMISEE